MLRPLPPATIDAVEPDDEPSLDGLADVLEPDADAITSRRSISIASVRHAAPPVSVRPAPAPAPDFAFADTVFASELPGDEPPESGPIFVNEAGGPTQCLTPLSFPLPPASAGGDVRARLRLWIAKARHGVRRSRDEMRDLWAGTVEMVAEDSAAPSASRSLPVLVRRVLAAWSCFQWSRDDITRAAVIGLAVFIAAAAVGAATLDRGDVAASGSEVRGGRTPDSYAPREPTVERRR